MTKILIDEATVKLALEALRLTWNSGMPHPDIMQVGAAIKDLEALAEPTSGDYAMGYAEGFNDACKPAQQEEPVAWRWVNSKNWLTYGEMPHDKFKSMPLYTSPPAQRTWVGLTDEERRSIREWQRIQEELGPVWSPMMLYLYEAIEAKLKEKNNG